MLVALYQDHHQLPWWHGNTNPFDVFSPEKYKDLPFIGGNKVEEIDGEKVIVGNETIPLQEAKQLFSFLSGLHNVEASHLMAHVSAMCGCQIKEFGYWHYPKRVWVQISTLPNEFTDTGVPIIYNIVGERKPEITHIWGTDNGTRFPSQFFRKEELQEMATNDSKIWTRFFVEQLDLDPELKIAKRDFHATEEFLKEAKRVVNTLQIFGQDKLNQNIRQGFNVC